MERESLASANATRVDPLARWKTLTLKNGDSYDNVFLKNHDPSGITISHSNGGRKIPYEELPADIQDELGGFDSQVAEAFREDERQAQLKAQKLASHRVATSKRKRWRQLPVSERYSITNNDKKSGYASLRYEDFYHLEKEVKHAVASQVLTKDDEEKKISLLPKGGRLIVKVYARSIGAANSKYFIVIIHDSSGREIARVKGSDSTASVPSRYDRRWWNLILIDLDEDIGDGIKIRVVDTLSNGFNDFEITPNL
jgi:type II secretory pathway pseudopilin PulG